MNLKLVFQSGFSVISLVFLLTHCSSAPEPVQEQPKIPGVLGEVDNKPGGIPSSGTSENPLVANISEKLRSLGYEALGLQFENDETLLLLGNVFDSSISRDRQIKIIYTGLSMSYDSKHQSLTIGGTKNLTSILNFIDKNIPKRDSSDSVEPVSPAWMNTPSAPVSEPAATEPSIPVVPPVRPAKKATLKPKLKNKMPGGKSNKKNRAKSKKGVPGSTIPTTSVPTTTLPLPPQPPPTLPAPESVKPTEEPKTNPNLPQPESMETQPLMPDSEPEQPDKSSDENQPVAL